MNRLVSFGLTSLFRGARRGQAPLAGLGAAFALAGYLRDRRGPKKELIYSRNLRDGEALRVRLRRGETVVDEHTVEG